MKKVLIVEDDEAMARMLMLSLRATYQVVVCTKKAHAVRLAKEHLQKDETLPDLVVIDLIINGTGGVEFYEWMREEGFECPVIFLTGCHTQSPEYRAAIGTGEVVYEKDDFTAPGFLAQVGEHIQNAA